MVRTDSYICPLERIIITTVVKRNINGNGGLICPLFKDKTPPEMMIVNKNKNK